MEQKRGIRKVVGKINGSNALRGELRNLSARLDAIEGVNGTIIDELRTEKQILEHIRTKGTFLNALNKQNVGDYLEKIYSRDRKNKAFFVLAAHEWGNIGDLAINYSETAFLNKYFVDIPVYNISRLTLLANWQRIKATITDNDIIIIPGGGNMGDIWPVEEAARRLIVKTFTKNTIISFPQSVKFNAVKELEQSARIYAAHKKMLMVFRDDASYELAKKHFGNTSILRSEDIVLSYEFPYPSWDDWGGVLFVARNDKEKRSTSGIEDLKKQTEGATSVGETDTLIQDMDFISLEYGARLVYDKVDELHTAGVVVPERLHGAVFALL